MKRLWQVFPSAWIVHRYQASGHLPWFKLPLHTWQWGQPTADRHVWNTSHLFPSVDVKLLRVLVSDISDPDCWAVGTSLCYQNQPLKAINHKSLPFSFKHKQRWGWKCAAACLSPSLWITVRVFCSFTKRRAAVASETPTTSNESPLACCERAFVPVR